MSQILYPYTNRNEIKQPVENEYIDKLEAKIAEQAAEIERLKEQHQRIILECEASSTQTKRIARIKSRSEAAINGDPVSFSKVRDTRENHIKHIGQLNYLNADLTKQLTDSQHKVKVLTDALKTVHESYFMVAEHDQLCVKALANVKEMK